MRTTSGDDLSWDSPRLRVKSDPPRRARYRLLQSWYREHCLGVPPGYNRRGMPLGNMLPAEDVERDAGLNFLDESITQYVQYRLAEVQAAGGTMEPDRLYRNMLSSQPLCFNLFGYLRAKPEGAATVLREALGIDITTVERIEVEYTPPAEQHLGDRTAFDAFVEYRTTAGQRGLLGIETKYTEPFSRKEYDTPAYRQLTERCGLFKSGAADRMRSRDTNQLWRNTLLAISLREKEDYAEGYCVVCSLARDHHAAKAVAGLSDALIDPSRVLRHASLETLIDRCRNTPALADWAASFRRRYLDLSPIRHVTV